MHYHELAFDIQNLGSMCPLCGGSCTPTIRRGAKAGSEVIDVEGCPQRDMGLRLQLKAISNKPVICVTCNISVWSLGMPFHQHECHDGPIPSPPEDALREAMRKRHARNGSYAKYKKGKGASRSKIAVKLPLESGGEADSSIAGDDMLTSDVVGGKRGRLADDDVSAASADDGDALDHHPTQAPASSSSAADVSPSAPLPPPAFDLLDRVTKVKTTGDIGTVCALVPGCETGSPGVFSYWLYRVAWDNGFPGPGVASEQLNDAAWLSMHCLHPEELPASDLAPAVMSRQ